MVVITFNKIKEYIFDNPNTKIVLLHWYNMVEQANWSSLADIKKQFPSADYVGEDRYVFNVKGNKYRIVAVVHFDIRTVYVRFIGSHSEYDKIDVIKV